MARLARLVVPDVAHHVTQRGNRRQPVFFGDDDYASYRELVSEACAARGVGCLAWCLMPNHVHLILRPPDADGLRGALAEAHRRYSRRTNFAHGWTVNPGDTIPNCLTRRIGVNGCHGPSRPPGRPRRRASRHSARQPAPAGLLRRR